MRGRLARIAFERGGLLAIAVLALYVWVAPAHVVDGDNAEFATLGALGGAAHPPGYPLFVLWLRVWAWLPGSPAHAAAVATALLGALSIVVLHAACRAWGARPLAATLACGVFAGAPVVLAMYTEAEVFALNGVIVGLVLWLAARGGPLRGWQRGAALGLVAGLGLANQLTCVLVAPIGVLGIVRALREGRAVRVLATTAGAFVLGLVPYVYLLLAPVNEASWGDLHGIRDLVHMFLRLDYGGPTTLATSRTGVSAAASLWALVRTLARTWLWVLAVAALAALAWRIARRRRDGRPDDESRVGWSTLAASFVLAGPVLAARFNIAPEGPGKWVVDRFHILPALLLAPAVACALDAVLAPIYERVRVPRALAELVAILAFAAVAGAALPHLLAVHAPAVERQVVAMLDALPPNALVIGDDDDIGAGTWYAQLVLGERPDVDYLHAPMFGLPWYRARIVARGFKLDDLIIDALARGRPVFVQPAERDIVAALPHYRFGIFVRVLPRDTQLPPLADIVAQNKAAFAHVQLDYVQPGPDDEWPTIVARRYAATWRQLAEQLAAAGERDDAARAAELAREIGPHQ